MPPTTVAEGPTSEPRRVVAWSGYAAMYAASFAALGAYLQFFPAWLHDVAAFGKKDIAVILSAQTISRTIAGPLWAQRVDRGVDARRVLTLLATGAVGAFALFRWADSLLAAWCVAFLFGCLYPPIHPILDAAAVRAGDRLGFSFGRLRVVGSLSFLVVIVAVGAWLERFGTAAVFPILLGALLLTACASRLVPGSSAPAARSTSSAPWWHLFRVRGFVLLLAIASLIQGSHATYYNLSTVHWNEHGIGKSTAALLWAEGVLAEIALLFFARQTFDRLRPTSLLLLGGCGAVVRWLVTGATVSVPWLFAVNWLHALSFAATYMGAIRSVERHVPAELRVTALALVGAAMAGIGMVFCGLCGGFAYEAYGGGAFWLMAAFAAVGVILAVFLRRGRRPAPPG